MAAETTAIALATDRLIARVDGACGWLVFNNPSRHNAVSLDMAAAVPVAIDAFERDPAVRVVIVTGAGERAFVAGSDVSKFGDVRGDARANDRYREVNERSYDAVYACAKPTIGMINGYCIGGGLEFAVSCDVRIAADTASFGVPAGRLGLGYGWEGVLRVGRAIGLGRARDLFLSARRLPAEEALRLGLVHRVVPAAELEREVRAYAELVADNAPLTLAAIKRAFLELERPERERDLGRAQALIDRCFASDDYLEGQRAFAEKRKPRFTGR